MSLTDGTEGENIVKLISGWRILIQFPWMWDYMGSYFNAVMFHTLAIRLRTAHVFIRGHLRCCGCRFRGS